MMAIQQQWPHAEIDFRDPAGVWGNAIDSMSTGQIAYGIKMLRNVTDKYAMNAAQFRAMAIRYSAPERVARKVVDNSERKAARDAATSAYAMRACGETVKVKGYHGDFDYMAVVNAAAIPDQRVKDHLMYWRRFWKAFDEAWSRYVH